MRWEQETSEVEIHGGIRSKRCLIRDTCGRDLVVVQRLEEGDGPCSSQLQGGPRIREDTGGNQGAKPRRVGPESGSGME